MMSNGIVLTGIRATMTPDDYSLRVDRTIDRQEESRCFILIADYQPVSLGEGEVLQDAVTATVQYLCRRGVDFSRSICFLQSQVPQLAELSRLLEGMSGDGRLACDTFRPSLGISEVADMLMFRPSEILGGKADRADFEVASMVCRTVGEGLFGQPTFVAADGSADGDLSEEVDVAVRDVLSFGGATARIEAQKTLEVVRDALGLNYEMFR